MDISHDQPRERITSRAHLTAVCRQAQAQWDHVQAIVLFGSRAKGTARPDSDWDIAVIVDDPALTELRHSQVTPVPPPFDRYENLDVLTLTPAMIQADRLCYGRVAQQIAQDGTALMGEWTMNQDEIKENAVINPREWLHGINTSLNHIHLALGEIHTYKRRTHYDQCDINCRTFIVQSQMAAEHLVKAIMTRRKVPPQKTHDISQLAQHMRNHPLAHVPDSDWSALTERVHALNDTTQTDHQAGYGTYTMTPEALTHATNRLVNTIPFLVDEIGSALHPARSAAAMGLSQACWGTDVHQTAIKTVAQGLLLECDELVATATAAFDATDLSKTPPDWVSASVVAFLRHVAPLEQLCRVELPQMLRQIRMEDDGSPSDPSSNPFEMDTTRPPSSFDTTS